MSVNAILQKAAHLAAATRTQGFRPGPAVHDKTLPQPRYLAKNPGEVMRKCEPALRAISEARVKDLLDRAGFDVDEFNITGSWVDPDEPRFRRVPRGYHGVYVFHSLYGNVRITVNLHEAGTLRECFVASKNGHAACEVHKRLMTVA